VKRDASRPLTPTAPISLNVDDDVGGKMKVAEAGGIDLDNRIHDPPQYFIIIIIIIIYSLKIGAGQQGRISGTYNCSQYEIKMQKQYRPQYIHSRNNYYNIHLFSPRNGRNTEKNTAIYKHKYKQNESND